MKRFANLLSTVAVVLVVLFVSAVAFGQGSAYTGTGTPGTAVDPTCAGGESVVLIQDVVPWGHNPNQDPNGADFTELEAQQKSWCSINSSAIGTTDLSTVVTIIIAAAQTQTFYDNLFSGPGGTVHPAIVAWVNDGGLLLAHLADNASGPGGGGSWIEDTFIGGVQHVFAVSEDDDIQDPSHPLVTNGLACPGSNCGQIVDTSQYVDLDGWGYSDHGYFTNLPEGNTVILVQGSNQNQGPLPSGNTVAGSPVTVEYSFGAGTVMATMATIEWRYEGGYVDVDGTPTGGGLTPNKKLLANEFALSVVTTPPTNFNNNPNTQTTVSEVFDNNPGQHVEADAIFPGSNDLVFPAGIDPTTIYFQENNRFVSNCQPYTIGTPFATCIPFDHAGNDAMAGTSGNGAKYEITCGDANHIPSEANCPTPSTATNTVYHVRFKDIFDLPTANGNFIQPVIPMGTTVSFIHWFPNLGGAGSTSWGASSTSPQPDCPDVFSPGFACDLEDALVNKYGPSNGFGSDTKKGDYLLAYNIPMLCSALKVNTMPVNTACMQGNSAYFLHSPLTFDFVVTPAQCPATQTCGNGWIAAPPHDVFYTFDPFSSAPDLPGATDFEDTIFCPGTNCPATNGVDCPGTSCPLTSGTLGANSAAPVEFTTAAMPENSEGQFLLQYAARDFVKITERNIQILIAGPCPNPFNDNPAPTPPCYSTKLFNVQIDVDNTAPTVSSPVLSPAPVNGTYAVGQAVTASVNCVDPISSGIASGVIKCGNTSFTPTPTPPAVSQTAVTSPSNPVPTNAGGKQNFTLTATDQAGNVGTSPAASYCVGYAIKSVDRNGIPGFTTPVDNPPALNLVGSSQAIALSLTVTDCNGNFVSNLDLMGSNSVGAAKTVVVSATNTPSGTCAHPVADNSISTASAGASGWQIMGNGVYQYNWKPGAPVGSCLAFSVNLGDSIQHTALFNVVKK